MLEEINSHVNNLVPVNIKEIGIFNDLLKHKSVSKKSFLLQQGEICTFEAFVVKGCLKSYFIDEHGDEVILTFAIENWWVSDLASFSEQKPSKMFIEAIEDSELLILTYQAKQELLERVPKFEKIFRLLIQRHLTSYQERLFSNIAVPAQERYLKFLEKYPIISQRVPQHLIASYLGVSPEFLSKIRSKLSKH